MKKRKNNGSNSKENKYILQEKKKNNDPRAKTKMKDSTQSCAAILFVVYRSIKLQSVFFL